MHTFAYSDQGKLVASSEADKSHRYFCPSCRAELGLRLGSRRKPHFYHLLPAPCRLSNKTEPHLNTQYHLLALLPGSIIEARFPIIDRIADLYWPDEKLILEIQCSPITRREIYARNIDYRTLGLETIWIFYDKTFGKPPIAPAYFTDGTGNLTPIQPLRHKRLWHKRLIQAVVDLITVDQ